MTMQPLQGMRVLDLGIITAGASASAMLGDLGAEVIKVEGPNYLDPFRVWVGRGAGDNWWNDSPQFSFTNRGKYGFCVDLKEPRGRKLLLELAEKSDIVLENFRVGVLDRLGLGFEALKQVNPTIILASISSQGLTGPDADAVSFGSTLEASGGLSSLITTPEEQPLISGHALNYPDQVVALLATGIILAAIAEHAVKGEAVHLDISQRELTSFMIGEWFSTEADPATVATQRGEERILRCVDGAFVATSICGSDSAGLADVVRGLTAPQAAEALRLRGHLAEPAHDAAMVYARHSKDKDVAAFCTDPDGHPAKGLPWRAGAGGLSVERTAPELGRDNSYVVQQVLGHNAAEYEDLVRDGIIATKPRT